MTATSLKARRRQAQSVTSPLSPGLEHRDAIDLETRRARPLATAVAALALMGSGCGDAAYPQQARRDAREAEGLVVMSKQIVLSGSDDLLIAVIKNSSTTTAVGVQPNYPLYRDRQRKILGTSDAAERIDQRPTIAPGERGVILDATGDPTLAAATATIEGLNPSGRRVSARVPMMSLTSARFNRELCTLTVSFKNLSDRSLRSSALTAVWYLTATKVLDAEVVPIQRPIPAGASRTANFTLAERYCRSRSVDLYVTPTLIEMERNLDTDGLYRLHVVAR